MRRIVWQENVQDVIKYNDENPLFAAWKCVKTLNEQRELISGSDTDLVTAIPPTEWFDALVANGAKRVFGWFFGWIYAIIYFTFRSCKTKPIVEQPTEPYN